MNNLPEQENGRNFGNQVFSYGLVQIIQRSRGLISFLLLTRIIGPYGYGFIGPMMALASGVQILVLFQVNSALNILIPRMAHDKKARDFWGIFQLTILSGLIALVLLLLGFSTIRSFFLPDEISFSLFFCGIMIIPLSSLQHVLYAQIVNNREGKAFSKITAIVSVIEVVLVGVGALLFQVHGVLIVYAISLFLQCVLMTKVVLKTNTFVGLTGKGLVALKEYYLFGMTIMVSGLATWAIDSSDRLILSKFVLPTELGTYTAIYNLCGQINELGYPMFSSLMPFVVTALSEGNNAMAKQYLEKTFRLLLFTFVPVVLILILCGEDLIRLLATNDFLVGASIIPYLAIGLALWQIGGIYNYNIRAHKKSHWLIYTTVFGAIVNITYNLIFIPRYGILAAAHSTLIAYAIMVFLNFCLSQKLLSFGPRSDFMWKFPLVCILSFVPAFTIQHHLTSINFMARLGLLLSYCSLSYICFTFLFNVFDRYEKQSFLNAVKTFLPKKP